MAELPRTLRHLNRELVRNGHRDHALMLVRARRSFEAARDRYAAWLRPLGCDLDSDDGDIYLAIIRRHIAYSGDDEPDPGFLDTLVRRLHLSRDRVRLELAASGASLELPADFLEGGPTVTAYVRPGDLGSIERDWEHTVALNGEWCGTFAELLGLFEGAAELLRIDLSQDDDDEDGDDETF